MFKNIWQNYATFLKQCYNFWKDNFIPTNKTHIALAVLYFVPYLISLFSFLWGANISTQQFASKPYLSYLFLNIYALLVVVFLFLVPYAAYKHFNIRTFKDFLPVFSLLVAFYFLFTLHKFDSDLKGFYSLYDLTPEVPELIFVVCRAVITSIFGYIFFIAWGFGALALFKRLDKKFVLQSALYSLLAFVVTFFTRRLFYPGLLLPNVECWLQDILTPSDIVAIAEYFLIFYLILYLSEKKKRVYVTTLIFSFLLIGVAVHGMLLFFYPDILRCIFPWAVTSTQVMGKMLELYRGFILFKLVQSALLFLLTLPIVYFIADKKEMG